MNREELRRGVAGRKARRRVAVGREELQRGVAGREELNEVWWEDI